MPVRVWLLVGLLVAAVHWVALRHTSPPLQAMRAAPVGGVAVPVVVMVQRPVSGALVPASAPTRPAPPLAPNGAPGAAGLAKAAPAKSPSASPPLQSTPLATKVEVDQPPHRPVATALAAQSAAAATSGGRKVERPSPASRGEPLTPPPTDTGSQTPSLSAIAVGAPPRGDGVGLSPHGLQGAAALAAPSPAAQVAGSPVTPDGSVQALQVDAQAFRLANPKPTYPLSSRRMGEEGVVQLKALVLEDGRVGEVELERSSGYARLDAAALRAVREWRYVLKPGQRMARQWLLVPIAFHLSDPA